MPGFFPTTWVSLLQTKVVALNPSKQEQLHWVINNSWEKTSWSLPMHSMFKVSSWFPQHQLYFWLFDDKSSTHGIAKVPMFALNKAHFDISIIITSDIVNRPGWNHMACPHHTWASLLIHCWPAHWMRQLDQALENKKAEMRWTVKLTWNIKSITTINSLFPRDNPMVSFYKLESSQNLQKQSLGSQWESSYKLSNIMSSPREFDYNGYKSCDLPEF